MRIFRSILAIIIAISLISSIDRESGNRLEASEEAIIISDHSACEAAIAAREAENDSLRIQLAEANRSVDLILRIDIEIAPGLFGDWSTIHFHSGSIRINAVAAEALSEGDELGSQLLSNSAILAHIIDCRIIIESISASA